MFPTLFVRNPEDRFSPDEAHLTLCILVDSSSFISLITSDALQNFKIFECMSSQLSPIGGSHLWESIYTLHGIRLPMHCP